MSNWSLMPRRRLLAARAQGWRLALPPLSGRVSAASSVSRRRPTIRPFKVHVPEAALVDLRQRIAANALARQGNRRRSVAGRPVGQTAGAGPVLGQRLRLAQGGSEAECLAAIHDDISMAIDIHFIHVRSRHQNALAADRHARLARICHRATQDHRSAHGSDSARRQRRGRVRRRHPVLAGLRLLRQADRHRLGPRPHRARLGGADAAPRLHPLRRAGRRLGLSHLQRDGAPGGRRLARHPHQPAGDGAARGGRGARRRASAGRTLRKGARGARCAHDHTGRTGTRRTSR